MSSRVDTLAGAPDVLVVWRRTDEGAADRARAAIRERVGPGAAERLVPQLAAIAGVFADAVGALPDAAFAMPGGEADWNVAQAIGHAADARAGLVLAASLAAGGRWPVEAPDIVPGVPGPADATREQLLRRLATSQRIVERAARSIAGHELDPCPLEHPLIGNLRCGEWLLFAGVHDLMHLDQLERLEAGLAGGAGATA